MDFAEQQVRPRQPRIEPQRMSDVSEAFRSAARVEQQKPITPKTIALLPQEEGAVRLPDHYKG